MNNSQGLKVYKCSSDCFISRRNIPAGSVAVLIEESEDYFGTQMVQLMIDGRECECSKKYFFRHFYFLSTLTQYAKKGNIPYETK